MPKRKHIFLWILFCMMLYVAMSDGIRYFRPAGVKKRIETPREYQFTKPPDKIVFAYDNFGGIVPAFADFSHKFFMPSTYPCHLSHLTHGLFGMKKDWRQFLVTLPYQKVIFHKEDVRKKLLPENIALPAIFLGDSLHLVSLVSAAELNDLHSLVELKKYILQKLDLQYAIKQ